VLDYRCALAEWQVVRARLVRTRLGIWLLVLAAAAVALPGPGDASGAARVATRVGLLAATLAVAFGAGSDADQAALPLALTHPTTPAAVAIGRVLSAMVLADAVVLAVVAGFAWRHGEFGVRLAAAALAGIAAAAAGAGCALAAAWTAGNALVGALFVYFALLSALPPSGLAPLFGSHPLVAAGGVLLHVLPGTWRGAAFAAGDPGAWLHALAWAAGGTALGARRLGRRLA
jgi:hypothetical protein